MIMNIYEKIRRFCRVFRIILGSILLICGFIFTDQEQAYNFWFALGIIPLIAGILNFCPLRLITKKCDLPQNNQEV